jgi:hypothetical protein
MLSIATIFVDNRSIKMSSRSSKNITKSDQNKFKISEKIITNNLSLAQFHIHSAFLCEQLLFKIAIKKYLKTSCFTSLSLDGYNTYKRNLFSEHFVAIMCKMEQIWQNF